MKAKLPALINKESLPKNIRHPYSFTHQFTKFEFSIEEIRVVTRLLQVIKGLQQYDKPIQIDINKNVEIRFKVKDLMPENSKNHGRVYIALKSLREKTLKNENAFMDFDGVKVPAVEMFGFIESASYTKNDSVVALRLKDYWFKYLMDLSHGYVQYLADTVFSFSNSYSANFYFFISHWFDKKGLNLDWNKFIEDFDIPIDYNISKIESRILNPVRNELNKMAEKSFNWKIKYSNGIERSFDEIKPRGVKPASISFVFYSIKDKELPKLSPFDHAQAQVFIAKMTTKYKLIGDTPNMLYGMLRSYGLQRFVSTELELKNAFKGLTDMDFLNKISIEVRSS